MLNEYLYLNEYYEDYRYPTHYFVCDIVEKGTQRLTEAEVKAGMVPEWLPLKDALEMFSHHQDYAETDEMRRGLYQREYTALLEYERQMVKKEDKP